MSFYLAPSSGRGCKRQEYFFLTRPLVSPVAGLPLQVVAWGDGGNFHFLLSPLPFPFLCCTLFPLSKEDSNQLIIVCAEGEIPMAKYDIPDTSDENDYKEKQ